jgi:hypothetical protein
VLTVVTSGKAAPGVTTSTWALALSWPGNVLVADCDPAGGDMAAGLLAGRVSADRGLLSWSTAARRGVPAMTAASMLAAHGVELPEQRGVWFVPGFTGARQGYSFTAEVWDRLSMALERTSSAIGRDALVDSGRIVGDGSNWPVLRAADRVLVAVRPSVRSVLAAHGVVRRLRSELGDLAKVSALIVGDGPYSPNEVAAALDLSMVGHFPTDRQAAAALSEGAILGTKALQRSALLKAAATVARNLTAGNEQNLPSYSTVQEAQ